MLSVTVTRQIFMDGIQLFHEELDKILSLTYTDVSRKLPGKLLALITSYR